MQPTEEPRARRSTGCSRGSKHPKRLGKASWQELWAGQAVAVASPGGGGSPHQDSRVGCALAAEWRHIQAQSGRDRTLRIFVRVQARDDDWPDLEVPIRLFQHVDLSDRMSERAKTSNWIVMLLTWSFFKCKVYLIWDKEYPEFATYQREDNNFKAENGVLNTMGGGVLGAELSAQPWIPVRRRDELNDTRASQAT